MPIKFVIGSNTKDPVELDFPRGMIFPEIGHVLSFKINGKIKNYGVDSITHEIDFDTSIKMSITSIRLLELKR
ncbi:MAG: hypothetical protein DRI84_09645 [Bacteroidetes bacterium]|jgi:hypothetical protein|nr:MAG: hypothetical protein DRI84_09645 [Bacteroidota bacterium]